MKEGWGRRATWLNTLAVPGKFEARPEFIGDVDVLKSLTLEWQQLVGILRSAVTRMPRNLLSGFEVLATSKLMK
eukprot:scaffold35698_cov63-Attheya_sp.AAC.9